MLLEKAIFFLYNIIGGKMYEIAINVLKKINENGFKAYIVGGFVRDRILNIESPDVDICTNATPMELSQIFPNIKYTGLKYGSVTLIYNKIHFEITTFRKDIGYIDNRIPKKVKYINNLIDDLKRRDFTINTICIDSEGNIIDSLSGIDDLKNKVVKMVGNPKTRLKEDSLRILRAIRFATILDFEIDNNLKKYIKKYGYLLKNLSKNRRKEELNKIFSSKNIEKGIFLLKELELVEHLELTNFNNLKITNSIIGIWAQIGDNYPFSNHEIEMMKKINELLKKDIYSPYNLYYYGLYVSTIAGEIKGISKKEITTKYNELPIQSRKDICINGKEIIDLINDNNTSKIKMIIKDLEIHILSDTIQNKKSNLIEYILKKYK